jgi:aldose 1-epimerase
LPNTSIDRRAEQMLPRDRGQSVTVLRAGRASATVDSEHGGMLLSVDIGGLELLQPPRPFVGSIPTHGSFLLAPWVGELFEGRLLFEGREYSLPRNAERHAAHGLVFADRWLVESGGASKLRLSRELGPPWPFGGTVTQQFELAPDSLLQVAEIHAGDSSMPVGIGWHPWFHAPDPDRVRICVDASHYAELDRELIPTGTVHPVAGVVDLRRDDVFGHRRIDVVLVDAKSPVRLAIGDREIELAFDSAISTVVVYSAEGTVCIEPWSSWADAIRGSASGFPTGNVVLAPTETLRRWMRWTWAPPPAPEEASLSTPTP